MSFLAPLFLFGMLAVSVPILLHLRRRKSQQSFAFPSLMFLEEVPHATIRRRRLRDLPLLLLRAGAVLLLALAFAQPALRGHLAGPNEGAKEVFLLVDRSASMAIEGRWKAAEEAVDNVLAGLTGIDVVTLALFDEEVEIPVLSSVDQTLVRDALQAMGPRDRRTSLSTGLRVMRPLLLSSRDGQREDSARNTQLVVISDFQRNGVQDLENLRLPAGINLVLLDVGGADRSETSQPANRWVQRVELDRGLEPGSGGGTRETVRFVAIIGAELNKMSGLQETEEPTETVDVSLWIDGREVQKQQVTLEGRATPVIFKGISLDSQRTVKGEVRLNHDSFPQDDRFYFTASAADSVTVVLGAGASESAGLYVQRSLESSRSPRYKVLRMRATDISQADLEAARAVVITDAGTLSASALLQLERFVRAGGGLLVAYGRQAIGKPVPQWIEMRVAADVRQSRSGIRLASVDENHPVFASIKGGDWGIAPFFRSFSLSEPSASESKVSATPEATPEGASPVTRVLARFSDGSVAMAERSFGEGKIIGFGSTLDTGWNDFPRQGAFLAWLDQTLRHLVAFAPAQPSYTVGEPTLIDVAGGDSTAWVLVGPKGETTHLQLAAPGQADAPETRALLAGQLLLTFETSGHAALREPGAPADTGQWFAANLDRRESELAGADLEVLEAQLTSESAAPMTSKGTNPEVPPKGFWWLVLYAALLLLVSEGIVASRARRTAILGTI